MEDIFHGSGVKGNGLGQFKLITFIVPFISIMLAMYISYYVHHLLCQLHLRLSGIRSQIPSLNDHSYCSSMKAIITIKILFSYIEHNNLLEYA